MTVAMFCLREPPGTSSRFLRSFRLLARHRSAVVDLVRSADDHGLARLEAGLHEHAVGKTRTLFNGAESSFPSSTT